MDSTTFKWLVYILFAVLIMGASVISCKKHTPVPEVSEDTLVLAEGWLLQSSGVCTESGETLSGPGFKPEGWHTAAVPTTVLAALVKNGVYIDPYVGKNMESIPAESFNVSWWYRKEFTVDGARSFAHAGLVFEGINYRANIWLNGKQVAAANDIIGSFRIHELDISPHIIKGNNILAVEVLPPKPGDFTIGFVDWNPAPPDKNMGLWREVKLRLTGPLSLDHAFVQTDVNLETLAEASLTVSVDVTNHSDKEVTADVAGKIGTIAFSRAVTLKPRETNSVTFTPENTPALKIENPRLWWPHNMGVPHLYDLKLTAHVNQELSDVRDITFGIREVSDYINKEGHRGYRVNGKEVLIRGGGWVDDLMLADDGKKIEDQFKYVRHMNLNTVRLEGFWGSSQTLYDLADKYGILLMAGWSCQWEWQEYVGKKVDEFGGIETPEEIALVARSLRDQVVWLRNHPSIFVWVVGSDKLPRPALEKEYNRQLSRVDPTRPLLAACKLLESEISGSTAVKMAGPYDYVTPNYWYLDTRFGGAFGFNTETGPGPQPPPLESIKRMIPKENLWPIDEMWEYHCGRNEFNTLKRYMKAFESRYGKPAGVEEFAFKAQAANYEAMRAMFEAFSLNRPVTTGIIQWMLNSAWPEMYWQLYDYYLRPNGAFYGAKNGNRPLNIIYNYGDHAVYLVNDTYGPVRELTAEIRVFNSLSKEVFAWKQPVNLTENHSLKLMAMPDVEGLEGVYFMDLKLKDPSGSVKVENFYWLSTKTDVLDPDHKNSTWFVTPNTQFADFTGLNKLPKVELEKTVRFHRGDGHWKAEVTLKNPAETIAFFTEIGIAGKESGKMILPVFWSDNYVSLLPGETKVLTAQFADEDLKGEKPVLKISGWSTQIGGNK